MEKTIREAKSHGVKLSINIVSVCLNDGYGVLGQVKVNGENNEMPAITELLNSVFIKDSLISIDAMG